MIQQIVVSILLLCPTIHAICNSFYPGITSLPIMRDGVLTVDTRVVDSINLPSTWCIELTDKIDANGVAVIAEVPDTIEITLSSLTATHRSQLTGAILANLPGGIVSCDDQRSQFCVLHQEVCDHDYGNPTSSYAPSWWGETLKTGYTDAKYSADGHGCACDIAGNNCAGHYREFTRIFMPPSNMYMAWIMSDVYQYQFTIDAGGTLFNANTSSTFNSYGTLGRTVLTNNQGATIIIELRDVVSGELPKSAHFIKPQNSNNRPMVSPDSWSANVFSCEDVSTPGWGAGGGSTFSSAALNAADCFRTKMNTIGWGWTYGDAQLGVGNGYDTSQTTNMQNFETKYAAYVQSSSYIPGDQLIATHTMITVPVDVTAVFPARKVIAYQDTSKCTLQGCSSTVLLASSSTSLNCICYEYTPGSLTVNITDLSLNQFSLSVVSVRAGYGYFDLLMPFNISDRFSICTANNCITPNITLVVENNLYNKTYVQPVEGDTHHVDGCTTCTGISAASWFVNTLSFQSLLAMINCIKNMDISCIVGNLFGFITEIIILVSIYYLIRYLYRRSKTKNDTKDNVVRIVNTTKCEETEMTPTTNVNP